MLIEMLSGTPPWAGMRMPEIMMQVAMKRQTPAIPDGVPQSVVTLLARCFVHDPAGRISAAELLEQLLQLEQLEPATAPKPLAGSISFCFSYASKGNARMEEAKAELEARGHPVFYGLDICATADENWRK